MPREPAVALSRSRGALRLAFARRRDSTVPHVWFQSGCLKARLLGATNAAPIGNPADTVLINTAGGLAGGDRLSIAVNWGEGTAATLATQAAEKVYRALDEHAHVDVALAVASGARAEWLPQETILFDRARLDRQTRIGLAGDATFLGLEAVVLGRTAMGERVAEGKFRDRWQIRRDGRLIYADALRLDGAIAEKSRRAAVAGGAIAFATLILVAPDAEARLEGLRAVLGHGTCIAAASAWNGLLATRFLAATGAGLRRDLVQAIDHLRPGRVLPESVAKSETMRGRVSATLG